MDNSKGTWKIKTRKFNMGKEEKDTSTNKFVDRIEKYLDHTTWVKYRDLNCVVWISLTITTQQYNLKANPDR